MEKQIKQNLLKIKFYKFRIQQNLNPFKKKSIMKKFILFLLAGGFIFSATHSQNIGEVNFKDFGYAQKKFDKAPKKIFVAQFRVVYQLMADWTESTQGGYQFGGGVKGKATARLAVGLQGIEEIDLKDITDNLYKEYIDKLKAEGYEIIPASVAANTEPYAGFEQKTGGDLSLAQYPGYIMSIPSGFEYFVKKTTKKGVEKKTFLDDSPKLSVAMDGAVIAKINLVVKFVQEAESEASKALGKLSGSVAKLVMETDLRVANDAAMGAGAMTSDIVQTQAMYTYAVRNIAPEAQCSFLLKDKINIPGIVEKKKYKSVETANVDMWGTEVGAMRIFSADNTYFENIQAVPVEAEKYKKGVYETGTKFIHATLNDFLSNAK